MRVGFAILTPIFERLVGAARIICAHAWVGLGVIIWTFVVSFDTPAGRIDTSQSFSLGR